MILVVDDTWDQRLLIEVVLQSAGYDVIEASGGDEAIDILLDDNTIDLIVLDVMMPTVDGWTTLRLLHEHATTRDIPVILCTARNSPLDATRGWKLGCQAYVAKPFDVNGFIATVDAVLSQTPDERREARAQRKILSLQETVLKYRDVASS